MNCYIFSKMQLFDFLLLAPRKMKPLQNRTLERKRILLKNAYIMEWRTVICYCVIGRLLGFIDTFEYVGISSQEKKKKKFVLNHLLIKGSFHVVIFYFCSPAHTSISLEVIGCFDTSHWECREIQGWHKIFQLIYSVLFLRSGLLL